eukprot:507051-Pyramimonas_sp.AAC.1
MSYSPACRLGFRQQVSVYGLSLQLSPEEVTLELLKGYKILTVSTTSRCLTTHRVDISPHGHMRADMYNNQGGFSARASQHRTAST